jgi:hypothetical protein
VVAAVARLACAVVGLVVAALLASGCGKSDLPRAKASAGATSPARAGTQSAKAGRAPGAAAKPVPVPMPLPLTSARARSFAGAVELVPLDVPGAKVGHEGHSDSQEEREAARCGEAAAVLADGKSPKLHRGAGLAQEDISSSTEVLASAAAVQSNLAYLRSTAGVRCYSKVLKAGLGREAGGGLRLLGLRIGRVDVAGAGGQGGEGLRIEAAVGLTGTSGVVQVFIDAVSFAYGPAEIDLYATSFVQPEPTRTEQQLLTLLRERASLQRL